MSAETLAPPPPARVLRRGALARAASARESGVFAAALLLCVVGAVATDGFLGRDNILNVAQQVSLVGIMSIGMTFVIVTGEIDLSIGSIYALSAVVCGLLITDDAPLVLAMAAGLVAGTAAGFANGAITVWLGLPSFIVTLGTLSVIRGITLLISDGAPISLDPSDPTIEHFSYLGQGKPLGIPMQFICLLGVAIAGYVVLRHSRFGFHLYAVGGSREAARLCGVPVNRVRIVAFTALGFLSAVAGILSLAFLNYVQGVTGTGLELTVITAVIVGGAALFGGSGTMLGTLIGVFLIGLLQNILALGGVSSFWQILAMGVVIILAVALDTVVRRRRGT
jgi:ribose transport system permease protein